MALKDGNNADSGKKSKKPATTSLWCCFIQYDGCSVLLAVIVAVVVVVAVDEVDVTPTIERLLFLTLCKEQLSL